LLSYLHLRDFALIDELNLEFFDGLNVLTGETGAGKSILIGAINLILGERSSIEQIRAGADQAIVEAIFHCSAGAEQIGTQLEQYGLPPAQAEEIVISREIWQKGRNICRINGRIVPLTALKELGSLLVDLHGQHSHQSLLKTEQQLFMLDEFAGPVLTEQKISYLHEFNNLQQVRQKLKDLGISEAQRERALDLLRFQLDEINAAALDEAEEENLTQRLLVLDHMERLINMANRAYGEIYEGSDQIESLLDRLNRIKTEITFLEGIDTKLVPFSSVLKEVTTHLNELGHDLYAYRENLNFFPEERSEVENRLDLYRRMKKKYGSTVADIHNFAKNCRDELVFLENSAEEALNLEKEQSIRERSLGEQAEKLTSLRKRAASLLEQGITSALKELGMPDARFTVSFIGQDKPTRIGKDEVEFLFSANRGEPVKPLARIISAGEISRVMLALKSILAAQDRISTMIFDEIDSGIGGETVQKVGEKMARLSVNHQVICVTHSSQIASAADHHYFVFKEIEGERTYTRVRYLEGESRITEIARLLDGSSDDIISRQHAAGLLLKNRCRG